MEIMFLLQFVLQNVMQLCVVLDWIGVNIEGVPQNSFSTIKSIYEKQKLISVNRKQRMTPPLSPPCLTLSAATSADGSATITAAANAALTTAAIATAVAAASTTIFANAPLLPVG